MYIVNNIGNNYIVKLNNKLLNLPHFRDLYFIEVSNFMHKLLYNKVQNDIYWVKYVNIFYIDKELKKLNII